MSSLSGKVVCFTGALEMKRADAKAQAEAAGATVTGSISGKTNILVAGPGAGAKMTEASAKGVEVWSEQEFIDALAAATSGSKASGKKKAAADAAATSGSKAGGKKKAAADAEPPAKKAPKKTVADSPSKFVPSTVVTSTGGADDGATADPDALVGMAAEGLSHARVLAHHKTVQIEVSSNTDKYFVMQSLQGDASGGGSKWLVFTRWGRTGTKGQIRCEGPYETAEEAHAVLEKKFKEKTGNPLSAASDGSFVLKDGKYDLVSGDTGAEVSVVGRGGGCLWQYYVGDGVDGKPNGWYDYTTDAAAIVEGVHSEWQNNQHMDVRCVQSGHWCYRVDFNEMKQTNVTHPGNKQRDIRRNA